MRFCVFLLFLFAFSSPLSAKDEFCMQFHKAAKINLYTNKGKVSYHHNLSASQIGSLSKKTGVSEYQHHPPTGLTVAEFMTKIEVGIKSITAGNKKCAVVNSVNYTMGYKNIDIYVDKKYEKGSCEYDVTLEHENTHLRIFQTSVDYYAPYFAKALKKSLKKINAIRIKSNQDLHKITQEIKKKLDKDLGYLSKFYEKARDRENAKLDTPENYKKTTALCKDW